jgi:hypothetical protein
MVSFAPEAGATIAGYVRLTRGSDIRCGKRIDELKKRPKDFWDIFQIVATLLIPASITLAGYLYSEAQKQAEIRSSERIAAQQRETSQMQVRVGQAQLISTFMESLLSDNTQRQKLAIAGVLVLVLGSLLPRSQ